MRHVIALLQLIAMFMGTLFIIASTTYAVEMRWESAASHGTVP